MQSENIVNLIFIQCGIWLLMTWGVTNVFLWYDYLCISPFLFIGFAKPRGSTVRKAYIRDQRCLWKVLHDIFFKTSGWREDVFLCYHRSAFLDHLGYSKYVFNATRNKSTLYLTSMLENDNSLSKMLLKYLSLVAVDGSWQDSKSPFSDSRTHFSWCVWGSYSRPWWNQIIVKW